MLGGNRTVMRLAADHGGGRLFELLIEGMVVEEYPVIAIVFIESILDPPD